MEDRLSNIGIYKIVNTVNNRVYIGSSCCLDKRKYNHFLMLRNGNHDNNYLQRQYDKYGLDKFEFIIIEYIDYVCDKRELKDILMEKELYWMSKYNSTNRKNGYNLRCHPNSNLGYIFTKKHRENISKARKGMKLSEEHKKKISISTMGENNHWYGKHGKDNPLSRPIINLTSEKVYESTEDAAKEYGVYPSSITAAMNGKINTVKGCRWARLDNNGSIIYPNYVDKLHHKIINVSESKIFNSIVSAAEYYGLKPSNISNVLTGINKTAGGYVWKYYTDNEED